MLRERARGRFRSGGPSRGRGFVSSCGFTWVVRAPQCARLFVRWGTLVRRVTSIASATALALVGGLVAIGPSAAVAQPPEPVDPSAAAERELRSESAGAVTIRRDGRGVVHLVGARNGTPVERPAGIQARFSPERKAAAHLRRYAPLWALDREGVGLQVVRSQRLAGDASMVRFRQTVDGVPVYGGELAVAVDAEGGLRSVSGETTPLAPSPANLTVTAEQARRTAVAVAARSHHVGTPALRAGQAGAYVYDPALLGPAASAGASHVWLVEVTGPAYIRHRVLVDRVDGSVALHHNQVAAADRVVCDRANVRDTTTGGEPTLASCATPGAARIEGGAASGVADVNAAYDHAGDTADFFAGELGVDLTALIGAGGSDGTKLRSTVRYCLPSAFDPSCPMVNAFWNGDGVYYGAGFPSADDIVAHELAHGVTEKTSDLAYWYQSGAINESMSDVFGELVDLTNGRDAGAAAPWALGEDGPGGAVRNMADPTLYGDPDRMTSGHYDAPVWTDGDFDSGGVHGNSGVGNKAAYLIAEPGTRTFNGQTVTGLGYAKAAEIYYRALTMLTSGADYRDLHGVLPQACTNLIGTDGIVAADCTEVGEAVTATEMDKQPLSANAKAPEASAGCTDSAKRNLFLDTFERSTLGSGWAVAGGWRHVTGYAKGGTKSLYGLEPDRQSGGPVNTYARMTKSLKIPSGVKTYLRFDHQFLLAYWPGDAGFPREHWAGGRVEYTTNGGKNWASAMTLPWDSAGVTPVTITPYNPDGSTGATYRGFGGDTHGYAASRVDLSSLAGKTVQLRWRITADPAVFADGWTLDNVNVYACGGATPSEPGSIGATGDLGRATVRWSPPLWPGASGLRNYRITLTWYAGSRIIDNISPGATSRVVTGLAFGTSYTFRVTPYSAAGAGPSVSKRLAGSRVSETLSPTTMRRGGTVKVSGRAYRSDNNVGYAGWTVRLQSRRHGTTAWGTVATKRTSGGGWYAFYRKPTATWQYRVIYPSGTVSYLGSISPVRTVTVR